MDDAYLNNEMMMVLPQVREMQEQAEALMSAGFEPRHIMWMLIIVFIGRPLMQILARFAEPVADWVNIRLNGDRG